MRVLVVDDSAVFRSQIKTALEEVEGISVVAAAANGKIALDRLEQTAVDVVILDLEMPEMSGLETISEMRRRNLPQVIIVFAAPSGAGIELVLAALRSGAADFVAKPNNGANLEQGLEGIKRELVPKILQFKNKLRKALPKDTKPSLHLPICRPEIILIGASTGGPAALESLLGALKGRHLRLPILISQHMPPAFTEHLARRLANISGHPAKEAQDGEIISPGNIYVCPGDFHMQITRAKSKNSSLIRLDQGPKRNSVRPAIDFLFESAAKDFSATSAAFVLTGMGEDGMNGAKALKKAGCFVFIQDQSSSVVWGMPGSVHASGAYDSIGNLEELSEILLKILE